MRIKEVENLTGLPLKTIKYYESEDLIFPKRNESNNYREYDEDDILILKKIKFLRKLGFSIEHIKNILYNNADFENALKYRMEEIDNDISTQKTIKEFIGNMLTDYNNSKRIDMIEYLSKISCMESDGYKFMDENIKETKFKKDSKTTAIFLAVYIICLAVSCVLLAFKIINTVVFLIIAALMLAGLIVRHAKTTGYICPKCGERFNISPVIDFISPQNSRSKYLKCPHCHKRVWAKESFRV